MTQATALSALFNLLTRLVLTIPSFSSALLSVRMNEHDEDSPSSIISSFCTVVRIFFPQLKGDEVAADVVSLAQEALELCECLCWCLSSDVED